MNHIKSYQSLFLLLSVLIIFFIPIFNFFLKAAILNHLIQTQDETDLRYYSDIIRNAEISLFIIAIILIMIFIFYNKINNYIINQGSTKILIASITLQVTFQITVLIFIETIQHADAIHYLNHGIRLAATGSYISQYGHPTAFWPVGIPMIIAIFIKLNLPPILSFQILNIIVANYLLWLLYKLLKNILSENEIKLFLILYSLYPNNLFITQPILTELPFIFTVWLSFYLLLKYRTKRQLIILLLIGMLIGVSTLIKANAILILIIFFVILISYFTKPLNKLLILLLGFLLIISPWIFRNYTHYKTLVISSTNGGYNFLMGNHKNSQGRLNFDFDYDFQNQNEPLEEKKAYQKAFEQLKNEPLRFITLVPKKLFYSYWRGDHSITWTFKQVKNDVPNILLSFFFFYTNLYFYILVGISFVGFLKWNKNNQLSFEFLFIYLFFVFNTLMIIIFVGSERYSYLVFVVHLLFSIKYFDKKYELTI